MVDGPVTARATEHPCQLHRYHFPRVCVTQGHHRKPVYLQNKVWGRIVDPEVLWTCGTSHDNIHAWTYWLMGERSKPDPEPGRREKQEADFIVAWFTQAMKDKEAA